jgi:hypothetical protein
MWGAFFYKYNMKKKALNELSDYIREQTTQEILKEILVIISQMNETIKRLEKALNEHTDFVKGGF